ncbi:MAG: nucleoside triphosphate pyrophosphohydrolase [Pseudomonadota bacterium]
MDKVGKEGHSVADLLRVMQRLREPELGCPWDLQQTFRSIVPSTLEECYELADSIERGEFDLVADELGDVLFQVVFYARLGEEQGLFRFEDVVHGLVDKLLRRHPHVFAEGEIEGRVGGETSIETVGETWETIKQQERQQRKQEGALADVPLALPALSRAQKLQKRAARIGFDWPGPQPVIGKLEEELDELRGAMERRSAVGIEEELGDVLFTCVNLARHLGLDAEGCLRGASRKFEQRFSCMEAAAQQRGEDLVRLTSDVLEQLWAEAKSAEPARDL